MVASGAASPKRFYIVLFLLQKYLIQLFLRTFWQGAWWHLGQPLLNVFIKYYSYYNGIIYYSF